MLVVLVVVVLVVVDVLVVEELVVELGSVELLEGGSDVTGIVVVVVACESGPSAVLSWEKPPEAA